MSCRVRSRTPILAARIEALPARLQALVRVETLAQSYVACSPVAASSAHRKATMGADLCRQTTLQALPLAQSCVAGSPVAASSAHRKATMGADLCCQTTLQALPLAQSCVPCTPSCTMMSGHPLRSERAREVFAGCASIGSRSITVCGRRGWDSPSVLATSTDVADAQ
jgi:hypothetical protein